MHPKPLSARLAAPARRSWLPLAVAVSGLAASTLLGLALRNAEGRQLTALSEAQAGIAAGNIRRSMTEYRRIFAGVAERHQGSLRQKGEQQFELTGVKAALWIEPSGKVGWVIPRAGNQELAQFDLGSCDACRDALANVREKGQASLTRSLARPGEPWFLLVTPVSGASGLEGYLVGVFAAHQLYEAVLRADTPAGWAIEVLEGDRVLYRQGSPVGDRWLAESKVAILGAEWRLQVGPGPEVAAPFRGPLPAVALAGGSLIALLFAVSVALAQAAWRRAQEAEAAQAARRKGEERYRLLFEANPQPMWVYDPATLRFLAVNAAAVHHYGYTADEFLGMTLADIRPAEDVDAVLESVRRSPDALYRSGVWRHRKKDGTLIQVEISSQAVAFGGQPGRLVLARDVTEQRRLEEQLRHAQKLEAIGQLAGGVAHDFNNMLGVISGYNDLLQKETAPEDPRTRRIEQIRKAAERAAGLTRQLLAFGRKHVLQPQVLDLNTLVGGIEGMVRRLIGEDVQLVTSLAEGLGKVKADAGQLEQVLMNLVVNARDAMPRGGRLTIETSSALLDDVYARSRPDVQAGPYVMLAVSDTGQGMPPEVLAHMFEPFFTTKEPGKGTGLGLATVHGIVKQSGGHVFVYSEVEQGTVFKIFLPVLQGAVEGPATAPLEAELPGGSETILLVEDEASLRGLVRECLESCGYTVLEALNPVDALGMVGRSEPFIHLLTTDVVMPGMSGRELAERAAKARPAIKVLYMSGYTDDAVVRHGVLAEAVAFLQKPFTAATLARRVREVLDRPPG